EIREGRGPVAAPACIIAAGETTVTVRGRGRGGRCQEFALAAALAMDGVDGMVALAAGTDGSDGPTDAAGGIVDAESARRAGAPGRDRRGGRRNVGRPVFLDDLEDALAGELADRRIRQVLAHRLVLELEHLDEARRLARGPALHERPRAVEHTVPGLAQQRPERLARGREGLSSRALRVRQPRAPVLPQLAHQRRADAVAVDGLDVVLTLDPAAP